MTPLRQRMHDAMVQRGFAVRTQRSYIEAVARLARFYRRDPSTLTSQEVEAYLLHLVRDRHLSYSTLNQAGCAARFLFEVVLGEAREHFAIPLAKVPAKQPELLSRQQIAALFAATTHPARRMLLQTIYATGLRVSEACALRVADIDSAPDRMCIRVVHGKGGKDRYTLLSATCSRCCVATPAGNNPASGCLATQPVTSRSACRPPSAPMKAHATGRAS
jgi:integrase/recombinase XerD